LFPNPEGYRDMTTPREATSTVDDESATVALEPFLAQLRNTVAEQQMMCMVNSLNVQDDRVGEPQESERMLMVLEEVLKLTNTIEQIGKNIDEENRKRRSLERDGSSSHENERRVRARAPAADEARPCQVNAPPADHAGDQHTKGFQVPNSQVCALLGLNGTRIGQIEHMTGVAFEVDKEPVKSNGTTVPIGMLARDVRITQAPTPQAAEHAMKIALDLVAGKIDARSFEKGIIRPVA